MDISSAPRAHWERVTAGGRRPPRGRRTPGSPRPRRLTGLPCVGGHHVRQAGDRDRLFVRARRRPAVAEHQRRLPPLRPPHRRAFGLVRLRHVGAMLEAGYSGLAVKQVAGCHERRLGKHEREHRAEQHAAAAAHAVHGSRPVPTWLGCAGTVRCCSCWLPIGHAYQSRQRCVASAYAFFDMPTICPGWHDPERARVDR